MSLFTLLLFLLCAVKGHSLQERNVLGNVLIVDHQVKRKKKKYIYVYALGHLERLYNAISDKNKT